MTTPNTRQEQSQQDPSDTADEPQDVYLDQPDASDSSEEPATEEQPPAAQPPPLPEPRVIQIPSASMKRIKEEERQRGRATAITEMNTEAKRLGFRSHEDMVKHVSQQRNKPKAAAAQPQQPAADGDVRESPRKLNALEREVQRLTDERKRQNRRVADLEKENKRLRTQIDAKEAESTLRVSAARHGVKDVEYALHVCRAACSGKSEDELRSFDEDRFFGETLRRTHPYLYAVEERPATTAPNAASQGRPEAPQAAPAVDPTAAGVDARKLSPAEYQELLRKRGLADPLVNAYAG